MGAKRGKYNKHANTNLKGRYIFFKMSKKQYNSSTIIHLTPNKSYEVIDVNCDSSIAVIVTDGGFRISVLMMRPCLHIDQLMWSVRREVKDNG